MSANGNEESTGAICHSYFLVVNAITLYSCTIKLPIYSAWGLSRVRAACPTPRLDRSYELRPPWERHLRYVPHRVRNGYNVIFVLNKNRRKEFLLVSFEDFEVVQLRVFLVGCRTLSLGVHCPVFHDHLMASSSRVGHSASNTLLVVIQ